MYFDKYSVLSKCISTNTLFYRIVFRQKYCFIELYFEKKMYLCKKFFYYGTDNNKSKSTLDGQKIFKYAAQKSI